MIQNSTICKSHNISFNGSLRINCKDAYQVAQGFGKPFVKAIHRANKELLLDWDNSVLLVTPTKGKAVTVSLDRKPSKSIEISLIDKPTRKIKKELVDAFYTFCLIPQKRKWKHPYKPQEGDIIATSNKGFWGTAVRRYTNFIVSHVNTILNDDKALSLGPFKGLKPYLWMDEVDLKTKKLYICKLSKKSRKKLSENQTKFDDFITETINKSYSKSDVLFFPIKKLFKFSENKKRCTCASIAADGLRSVGLIPQNTNISRLTPKDVMEYGIYTNIFERIIRLNPQNYI